MLIQTLTVWQPYAQLLALGTKPDETRTWCPRLAAGDLLAIHAAAYTRAADDLDRPTARAILDALRNTFVFTSDLELLKWCCRNSLPRGRVVALCRFLGARPTEDRAPELEPAQLLLGDYSPGRWAWHLEPVVMLADPIPATGRQLLWWWDPVGPAWAQLERELDEHDRAQLREQARRYPGAGLSDGRLEPRDFDAQLNR